MHRALSAFITIIIGTALFFITLAAVGCGNAASSPETSGDTPTAAYKRLFVAVKAKDINAIKTEMSKRSNIAVQDIAKLQKKAVEDVYLNALTSTVLAENLPEIRDERIKGDSGAVEVYNISQHKWEDVPFIFEDGKWKLALGDALAGKYTWPGKGRDAIEKEAANALGNGTHINVINANITANK